MQKFFVMFFLLPLALMLNGCIGTAQKMLTPIPAITATAAPTTEPTATIAPTSTPAPTALPLPTNAPTALPSPLPTRAPAQQKPTQPMDPTVEKLIQDARADLAKRANVDESAITVKSVEPREWSDSSLGCPVEGMMYAQVITPGYLIVLEANGQAYEYHASYNRAVYCEK